MGYLQLFSLLYLFNTIFTTSVKSATLYKESADASMACIDYATVPITEKPLHVPPLEELVDVLSRGLRATFQSVAVSAEECPDLTQPPYNLTAPGLSGSQPVKLVELGGPPYLVPSVRRDKLYDLAALLRHERRDPALLLGAGAGPWPYAGVNCEGIVNLYVKDGAVQQGTRIVTVQPVGAPKGSSSYLQRRLPPAETRSALLGNYLLTDGQPGRVSEVYLFDPTPVSVVERLRENTNRILRVIKVVAENRVGPSNFITAIRETLKQHYGDKVVGLGGAFLLAEGRARHHVMPQFSEAPLCSDDDVDAWLHYFEVRAPIIHVGTLVTGDLGLDLRVQHFHGFSAHGDGGHYHYDTTPDSARYEGYLVPAAAVLRVDAPPHTHTFGRD